jgi:hypothetical protein
MVKKEADLAVDLDFATQSEHHSCLSDQLTLIEVINPGWF